MGYVDVKQALMMTMDWVVFHVVYIAPLALQVLHNVKHVGMVLPFKVGIASV
jgi:hypothetical protein